MLRFGEEETSATQQEEERESGDGGSRAQSGQQQQQKLGGNSATPSPLALLQHGSGDFRIAAVHHGAEAATGCVPAGMGGAAVQAASPSHRALSSAELFGSEASNGRRLSHAMQTEVEQRGAADAGQSLLQVQGTLAEAQQRLLDSQRQLMAQHASVLRAIGSAAGSMQPGGGGNGGVDTGWGSTACLTAASFRQQAEQRSDSGRAAGLLPPGRPVGAMSARGLRLRLSTTSEEEANGSAPRR